MTIFIFEGPDGVGKTTLIEEIASVILNTRPYECYTDLPPEDLLLMENDEWLIVKLPIPRYNVVTFQEPRKEYKDIVRDPFTPYEDLKEIFKLSWKKTLREIARVYKYDPDAIILIDRFTPSADIYRPAHIIENANKTKAAADYAKKLGIDFYNDAHFIFMNFDEAPKRFNRAKNHVGRDRFETIYSLKKLEERYKQSAERHRVAGFKVKHLIITDEDDATHTPRDIRLSKYQGILGYIKEHSSETSDLVKAHRFKEDYFDPEKE